MPKSEKHNDPTKKKRKGKKSEEDFPPRREIVEPDIRKTKTLRRSPGSAARPLSISKILEEKTSQQPIIEEKKSKILRFRTTSTRRKSGTSTETSSQISESDLEYIKTGKLKKKKSEISQFSNFEAFIPPSSKSSFSVEIENEVLLPIINQQAIFEEFPSCSSMDKNDYDLLHATFLRDLSMVKLALERGANVNAVKDRLTPLIIATEYADLRLINYLLRRKNVDINYRDHHGQTALMIAIRNGLDEIAEELIYRGADVDLRDNLGRTALHIALFHGNIDLAKILLAYGADVSVQPRKSMKTYKLRNCRLFRGQAYVYVCS